MKNLPTQERAIRKRIALLKAAHDEFSESGFDVATAKSIAARADVATGTFYQYFDNKDDILRVIAENRYSELHEQISMLNGEQNELGLSPFEIEVTVADDLRVRELFKRVLRFLYTYHLQETELHQVLEQRRSIDLELNEIMDRGEQLMKGVVLKFIEPFSLNNSLLVAEGLYAMGEGLVHHLVFGKTKMSGDSLLDTGAEMLASYFEKSLDKTSV